MPSNAELLTHGHRVIQAKKRAKRTQVEAVVFDDDARREFLTGFRKRNIAKKEAKRQKAKDRERQERLQARAEQRKALAERARENAQIIESQYGNAIPDAGESDDEQELDASAQGSGNEKLNEYEDEEQLATVTVVEEFDPASLLHGPSSAIVPRRSSSPPHTGSEKGPKHAQSHDPSKIASERSAAGSSKLSTKNKSSNPTPKPKKVAYETKAARKAAKTKQRARKLQKADAAGGRAKRKPSHSQRGKRR